jgi:hypothetical protein
LHLLSWLTTMTNLWWTTKKKKKKKKKSSNDKNEDLTPFSDIQTTNQMNERTSAPRQGFLKDDNLACV